MSNYCYICNENTNDYHRLKDIANLFSEKPVFRCVVARIAGFLFIVMDFIVKKEWINGLSLKGNKLMIYAMIHGYCVSFGEYSKGILYISKYLGINKSTVIDCLKWLCQKGLLIKSVQSVGEPDIYKIVAL
jgi:hypothetical protein